MRSDQVLFLQERYADLVNYDCEDVDLPIDPMTYTSADGDSLIHIAAFRGDMASVELLLDAGINPNMVGDMGCTPLHYAAMIRDRDIADLLIRRGARVDAINEFGEIPDLSAF